MSDIAARLAATLSLFHLHRQRAAALRRRLLYFAVLAALVRVRIECADWRLYLAKSAGRNCVIGETGNGAPKLAWAA